MLQVAYPDIFAEVAQMAVGIRANRRGALSILVVKASARVLLAAKLHKRLKFHFVPVEVGETKTTCVLTAFPDNEQHPSLIWTPLYDEESTSDLISVLSNESLHVYFLDEKNRPLLSYIAASIDFAKFAKFAKKLDLASADLARTITHEVNKNAGIWFSKSGPREDRRAFEVLLKESLFPENLAIFDLTATATGFHGSSMRHTSLEYVDPGARQEPDIAEVLSGLLGPDRIFLNPLKTNNMEELCDVMVSGDLANYFFQLKSSPNTEAIIARDIRQSKNAVVQHIKKAVAQTRQCVDYIEGKDSFEISLKTDRKFRTAISQKEKNMIFIIATHEAFPDELRRYAETILELAEPRMKVVCHLAETSLYQYFHYCENEKDLIDLLVNDFNFMLKKRSVYNQELAVKLRVEKQRERPPEPQ